MKVKTHLAIIGMLTLTLLGCQITNPTLREKALTARQEGNTDRAIKLYSKALSLRRLGY